MWQYFVLDIDSISFQSSWIRLYHEAVPSYESASTSQFQFGRTDTIRAATPESLLFTLNMDRNEISVRALLHAAFNITLFSSDVTE